LYNLNWTDDAGAESSQTILGFVSQQPPTAWSGDPGNVVVFQSKTGQPVTFSVNATDTGVGTYSLYFTVERLM
jgi:hypothetical protein